MKKNSAKRAAMAGLLAAVIVLAFCGILTGSSGMSLRESLEALFSPHTVENKAFARIIWNIRIPRVIAALAAGAGLSVSGLIMQTTLNNPMASPSTLGVSNAAVFGANLSIIAFAGGYLSTGHNVADYMSGVNPFAASLMAFLFATFSILLILGLCRARAFTPNAVVLAGIAAGSIWSAGTTLLQYHATDVGISAAVIWNFGDLGRATYKTDLIMVVTVLLCIVVFRLLAWRYNALLSGDAAAKTMGVNVERLRFVSLLLGSLITAVCVSFLGIIGFVGIICPHVIKKWLGQDHRYTIFSSAMAGSLLLLAADTISRGLGNGSAIPIGAITTLLGGPFFLILILTGGRRDAERS